MTLCLPPLSFPNKCGVLNKYEKPTSPKLTEDHIKMIDKKLFSQELVNKIPENIKNVPILNL